MRWYVAYPISYRQLEEMMQERVVAVDHSSLNRWVLKCTPALDKTFRQRKRFVGTSWRLDETYIRVKGQWKYRYRGADKAGHTVDFLLTTKRDRKAADFFAKRSIRLVCRKRSPSMKAAPTPPRSTITTPTMRPTLNFEWLASGHRQST